MYMRSPYNYDTKAVSIATGLACLEPTMTQQQYKDECDINTIMRRYAVTGVAPQTTAMPGYDDYSGAVNDYQTAMNLIIQADRSFAELPAIVRRRFDNDPQKLLAFMADERNYDELKALGLTNVVASPPPTNPAAPT